MFLCVFLHRICVSHLKQRSVLEKKQWARTGVCFRARRFDKTEDRVLSQPLKEPTLK